jgi:hypothetical protein
MTVIERTDFFHPLQSVRIVIPALMHQRENVVG